jgi:hypothetical protein
LIGLHLNAGTDDSTGLYTLKRKASQQLHPAREAMRDQPNFEELLDQLDLRKKLWAKNEWLTDHIKLIESQIDEKDVFGIPPSPDLSAWITMEKASKQACLVKLREEHRLRTELSTTATEYRVNTKLKSSTASIFPSVLTPWWIDRLSPAITSESLNANIAARGVQRAHQLLDEKRLILVARAVDLERELKALGQPIF